MNHLPYKKAWTSRKGKSDPKRDGITLLVLRGVQHMPPWPTWTSWEKYLHGWIIHYVKKRGCLEEEDWIPKRIISLVIWGAQHIPSLTKLNVMGEVPTWINYPPYRKLWMLRRRGSNPRREYFTCSPRYTTHASFNESEVMREVSTWIYHP